MLISQAIKQMWLWAAGVFGSSGALECTSIGPRGVSGSVRYLHKGDVVALIGRTCAPGALGFGFCQWELGGSSNPKASKLRETANWRLPLVNLGGDQ